ncbi:phytoene/squalene synthase family protein [Roseomonas populi]|uniref:Squalene/phytoene synthase family protein n=1 Tax=Roseomonas populi TaxID=3121582 RepID=A0ABT1X1W1_9PROT|nr:squalene/phytoene synthase family protein [Roseomonas pecuniae]MCR0981393.1 squalene/phytoene synthase family protein [Roseomonas pecuniae]
MAETPDPTSLAEFARRHDPDRFLCALFAPAGSREAIFTLIAFNHELARAREAAREPMMVLIRLQWWRDAVEEAVAGKPARRHEVAGPLSRAIGAGSLDPAALLALIEAREADETGEEAVPLLERLRGTAGGLAAATGRLLGAPDTSSEGLRQIGTAYGVAGTLRSLPALAAQGRDPLPEGEDPVRAGQALARKGLEVLESGRKLLASLPSRAVAAALPGVLARRDLQRVLRPDWQPGAPAAPRGAGDRLAVTWAGLRGRA